MINKKYLAKKIASRTLLTQKEAVDLIDEIFELITIETSQGKEVVITGFGKFYLYNHKPRPVRNPKTQEEMTLKPYKSIKFKSSNVLRKLLKTKSYNEDL